MAYQKKATALVLNCAASMAIEQNQGKPAFKDALNVLVGFLQDKVLAGRKTDMTSVILASTKETDNELAEEDQYRHITTMSRVSQPNLELLRKMVNVTPAESEDYTADILDALILAIQIINEHCRTLKYTKKVVMITNAVHSIDWRDISDVESALKSSGISLLVIGVEFDGLEIKNEHANGDAESNKAINQRQWKTLVERVPDSELISLSEAVEQLNAFRTKQVRPTPTFRGFLHLGDPAKYPDTTLSISVHVYARTYELRPESAKKWSTLSDLDGSVTMPTHGVIMERKYRTKPTDTSVSGLDGGNNGAQEQDGGGSGGEYIDESTLERAYRFGKSLVKVSAEEEGFLRLETEPGMWILGFTSESSVRREYWISNVYVLTAGSHRSSSSEIAIASLANALYEKKAVALVRYVSRVDAEPKIGILTPHIDVGVSVLHFIQMPFAEDVRQFTFSSLDKVEMASGKVITQGHSLLPTDEMSLAMDFFVDSLDLMTAGPVEEGEPTEALVPENSFNPAVWRLHEAIKTRALNDAAPIPDNHPTLQAELQPLPCLADKTKEMGTRLQDLFKVTPIDRAKAKRGYAAVRDAETLSDTKRIAMEGILGSQQKIKSEDDETSYASTMEQIMQVPTIEEISSLDPVSDFHAMVKNTQKDLVGKAVDQMGKMVLHLVTTSFGDQYYQKAIDCLVAFRATAAKENESGAFNETLRQVKKACDLSNPNSRRLPFWVLLQQRHLSLITRDEAKDDEVVHITSEDAENFLTDTRITEDATKSTEGQGNEDHGMNAEDLLAMME